MSTDYYLYSPSTGKHAQVGSVGLGGIQSYPGSPEVVEFIRWAIDASIDGVCDIKFVNEHQVHAEEEFNDRMPT